MRNDEGSREGEMGSVVVEKVGGRSSATTCFSRYPLKFFIPKKVGSSKTDAVWVYAVNYGGGIVSGDHISCKFCVGDSCTMVLTTQGSTKVYKSVGSKCSQQILETLLEKEKNGHIQEHMHNYQVIAMILLLGPKMQYIQNLVQDNVKKIMSEQLLHPSTSLSHHHQREKADHLLTKPSFIASCSAFGPKKTGLVVRVAAETTESVYKFLRLQLAPMEPMIGVPPYKTSVI
ncbi:urease accessory protein D isoform X2 [Vigna radiata var. radiata]|uniref:Urease accessory protein D isoform X2 n=1 Tax=Vigna radiata var. radiata TaxID=3916 RepID=A0A3Q0F933_VIGRR|nr:urease accessory protein D isoform X2 [Vigna radiata var. radiata]